MTHGEFDLFLFGTIVMCCVMAVFNSIKNWHRGWPGLILSVCFLVFAVTIYLYKTGTSESLLKVSCGVLFVLLVIDFIVRAGSPQTRKKR